MSELGKIRAGSPRVFRDRVFGVRGQCIALGPDHSADRAMRFVFHPCDIDELMQEVAIENIGDLEHAAGESRGSRPTVFGMRMVASSEL